MTNQSNSIKFPSTHKAATSLCRRNASTESYNAPRVCVSSPLTQTDNSPNPPQLQTRAVATRHTQHHHADHHRALRHERILTARRASSGEVNRTMPNPRDLLSASFFISAYCTSPAALNVSFIICHVWLNGSWKKMVARLHTELQTNSRVEPAEQSHSS